jgi:hypothetical protein
MSVARGFQTLFFWVTVLLGTALLAPCLLLPAWLERQAQIEYLKAHEQYLAALKYRLQATQKQIEHLNDDPAYLLRLAEQEFGGSISVPNVESILIEPGPDSDNARSGPPAPESGTPGERADQLLPELSTFIDQAMQRHPYGQVFLDSRSRPLIMALGGVLLLTGIVLLGLVEGRRTSRTRVAGQQV